MAEQAGYFAGASRRLFAPGRAALCGARIKKEGIFARVTALLLIITAARLPGTAEGAAAAGDAVSLVSICQLQGKYFSSPYEGQAVRTQGIVYGDLDTTGRHGLFLQAAACDRDPATSDGIFLHLGVSQETAAAGDLVEVTGTVQEYFGRTEINASPGSVTRLSSGNHLPQAVELSPPFDPAAADRYFEALEGMYVRSARAAVTGPTDTAGETWGVPAVLGIERIFSDDPRGAGEVFCIDQGGLFAVEPQAKVGDQLLDLAGALDYTDGVYRLRLLAAPSLVQSAPPPVAGLPSSTGFSAATLNLANLFDTLDDPDRRDSVLTASEFQRRLQKHALLIQDRLAEPDLIAVQEVENEAVLQALLSRPEIQARYVYAWVDGPDERGLDVALLYRTDRVQVMEYAARQGCTRLVDGLGPDGNGDVRAPQNRITCDSDGDGNLDGNRLFARPPLLARVRLNSPASGEIELLVIANHFKSRSEDTRTVPYTLPRRLEEARFVAGLAEETAPGKPVLVLGDLNDTPDSQPLSRLAQSGLLDLWPLSAPEERYSYIFRGVSQALDYLLARFPLRLAVTGLYPVHANADFPAVFQGVGDVVYRSSDHDPVLIQFRNVDHLNFLPQISR